MDNYTARHKYLLQIITRERMFEQNKLVAIHRQIFENRSITLDETIKLINGKLRTLNLKISKVICEISGKTMYVLHLTIKLRVNLYENSLTLSQKEFMSLVFQGIISSNDGRITTSTALNYGNSLKYKGLKLIEAEQLIKDLIRNNLLMYTDGKETSICFTPLTMLEMETEFRESFPDITDCPLCKQIILKGISCDHCYIKIHSHCLKSFSLKRKTSPKCPDCKNPLYPTK